MLRKSALFLEACLRNLEPMSGRAAVALAEDFAREAPGDNRAGELFYNAAARFDDEWLAACDPGRCPGRGRGADRGRVPAAEARHPPRRADARRARDRRLRPQAPVGRPAGRHPQCLYKQLAHRRHAVAPPGLTGCTIPSGSLGLDADRAGGPVSWRSPPPRGSAWPSRGLPGAAAARVSHGRRAFASESSVSSRR